LTLQQLRYFLATAQHGSFAGAADELLLKQPSVAEQVRRLEAELGVPLFASKRRRLILTAAGTALRPYAEQALATCQDGADAVRAHRTLRGGVASFGLPRNAELYELTDLAAEVAAKLTWTRDERAFDTLNLFNRMLATTETITHLELLANRGDLTRSQDGEILRYGAR
jgi:DNA-binding transcriptional LysR family regulator